MNQQSRRKLKRKRGLKKTLTVSEPFKFQTLKRKRTDEGLDLHNGDFHPLVNQVGQSFRWRESIA